MSTVLTRSVRKHERLLTIDHYIQTRCGRRPPQDYLLCDILPAAARDRVILGISKTITATFAIVANSIAPSLRLPTLPATSMVPAHPTPPSLPSHPLLAPSSPIALLPPLETGQMVYHVRQKHIVVRAWPHTNTIPDRSLAHFDVRALSQLRLHKSFRVVKELSTPDT